MPPFHSVFSFDEIIFGMCIVRDLHELYYCLHLCPDALIDLCGKGHFIGVGIGIGIESWMKNDPDTDSDSDPYPVE